MKERPILFNGPMVRAVLEDRKTQTRRIVTKGTVGRLMSGDQSLWPMGYRSDLKSERLPCPHGEPGDRLWVRETFQHSTNIAGRACVRYRADGVALGAWADDNGDGDWVKVEGRTSPMENPLWRPSIHMPRWASRLTLEITHVRVERLNEISAADAVAEGISGSDCWNPKGRQDRMEMQVQVWAYRNLWESINGPGSWLQNPWVWVVSFRRIKP